MKKKLMLILISVMAFFVSRNDSFGDGYLEMFSLAGPDISIPFFNNIYGGLYGLEYGFYVVNDRFLAGAAVKMNAGYGRPVIAEKNGIKSSGGLYPDEWSAEGEFSGAGYISGFLGVEFGWNVSHLFLRRQFVTVGMGWFLDREEFEGGKVFNSGRYATSISILSGAVEIMGIKTYVRAGISAVPNADMGTPGMSNYFGSIGIKGYISNNREQPGALYEPAAPASDSEPEKRTGKDEEAVWED
ncbi:MAG TPA: hypothetical protein ENN55_04905 [Firmicutes bacterium]|nr:hypothetical protein [Bacillota bacterium]